ncbi:MAG: hypothetical protein JKY12_01500 [Sneathiella sp.]|nr:hypothetical protein [Sneathiella sp.]
MTKNPLAPSTQPTMEWAVTDIFLPGQHPTEKLRWVHDPDACILIKGDDQPWYNLLALTYGEIGYCGYPHGLERAAILTIMNLIPDLKGPLSQKFTDRLYYLFDVCAPYLDTLDEEFVFSSTFRFQLRKIIKGNLFRALLDDAQNNALPVDQWRNKAQLFMEFVGPDDWKNRQCWNEGIHTSIKWPDSINDKRYPSTANSPIRPDLLTCLCLFEEFEYADCLIDMGYDLSHFLLFNFQMDFWRQGGENPSFLKHVRPFCIGAVDWVKAKQKEPEPSVNASEWDVVAWHRVNKDQDQPRDNQISRDEYKSLLVLKTLSNELSLNEVAGNAVEGANAYLGACQGLSLPEYTPEFEG